MLRRRHPLRHDGSAALRGRLQPGDIPLQSGSAEGPGSASTGPPLRGNHLVRAKREPHPRSAQSAAAYAFQLRLLCRSGVRAR